MRIKDIPISERPRERLVKNGAESLSNEDLLAIIIKTGCANHSVKDISLDVLKCIDNIHNLQNINLSDFSKIKGLGKVKIIELIAAIELGKRVYLQNNYQKKVKYHDPSFIYKDNLYLFHGKKQEYFYVFYLDNKNTLIKKKLLFMGTINQSIVHPREIFKEAYLLSSSSIICMHNHPSGDNNPSQEDIKLTRNLKVIGDILGIKVLDHIIVTENNYYSFCQEGEI